VTSPVSGAVGRPSQIDAAFDAAIAALIADGAMPGMIVGTPSQVTSDSSTFTTSETEVQTITVPVTSGRVYSVTWWPLFRSSVANDEVRARIREDSSAGTEIQTAVRVVTTGAGALGTEMSLTAFYTAGATEDKTFSLTGVRVGGSGNINLEGASGRPSIAVVRYEYTP
jgi:hypothetical protein